MKLILFINIAISFGFTKSENLLRQINNKKFIPGQSCGTLTPLKYLTKEPRNASDYPCAVIIDDKIQLSGKQKKIKTYVLVC